MRSISKNSKCACADWRAEIEVVLQADLDSEIRTSWEVHALTCDRCAQMAKEDLDIIKHIRELHTPTSVGISAAVMERINQSGETLFGLKPQHFVWGLSTSIVGFVLGFIMSGMSLEPSFAASTEDYFEQTLIEINTGVDSFVTALVQYDEDVIDE